MTLASILSIVTIISLSVPLAVAATRYYKGRPTKVDDAKAIQGMTFDLVARLDHQVHDLETRIAEMTDQIEALIIRARMAESEREDAYELLRDHGIPKPSPRIAI